MLTWCDVDGMGARNASPSGGRWIANSGGKALSWDGDDTPPPPLPSAGSIPQVVRRRGDAPTKGAGRRAPTLKDFHPPPYLPASRRKVGFVNS